MEASFIGFNDKTEEEKHHEKGKERCIKMFHVEP